MMLVDADRVETAFGGVFEFVHEIVVHVMRPPRIEQRRMDVDPDRWMLLAKIVGQLGVRHQVEPHQLHEMLLPSAAATAYRTAASGRLFQATNRPNARVSARGRRPFAAFAADFAAKCR